MTMQSARRSPDHTLSRTLLSQLGRTTQPRLPCTMEPLQSSTLVLAPALPQAAQTAPRSHWMLAGCHNCTRSNRTGKLELLLLLLLLPKCHRLQQVRRFTSANPLKDLGCRFPPTPSVAATTLRRGYTPTAQSTLCAAVHLCGPNPSLARGRRWRHFRTLGGRQERTKILSCTTRTGATI